MMGGVTANTKANLGSRQIAACCGPAWGERPGLPDGPQGAVVQPRGPGSRRLPGYCGPAGVEGGVAWAPRWPAGCYSLAWRGRGLPDDLLGIILWLKEACFASPLGPPA